MTKFKLVLLIALLGGGVALSFGQTRSWAQEEGAEAADGALTDEDFEEEISEDEAEAEAEKNAGDEDDFESEFDEEPAVAETPEPPGEAPKAESPAATQPTPEPAAPSPVYSSPDVEVTNIKYLANQSGGSIVIDTSTPAEFTTRTNSETNQFIIEVKNATLPDRLKRPYLMKEFEGASFGAINAYQSPGASTARIVVQLKRPFQPTISQDGSSILVLPSNNPIQPGATMSNTGEVPQEAGEYLEDSAAPAEGTAGGGDEAVPVAYSQEEERILGARTLSEFLTGNNKYYGKRINIWTKEGDVRDVINFIAEESGTNIVISDDVKGTVTIKLRQVPWDQALVILLRSHKLGYVRQGNVLRISTLAQLRSDTQEAKTVIDSQKQLDPLRVKVFPVSYAKVEDLTKQLDPFLTPGRGKAVADKRTSSLILTDTDETIRKVTRLIKELDIPPAQVMIEGKIVEASEDFSKTVGVNWKYGGSPVSIAEGAGVNKSDVNLSSNLSINPVSQNALTASTGALSMNIGVLNFFGSIDAVFALAELNSLVKVLSSPRVVTINKEEAEISQKGETISISAVADQGGTVTKQVTRTPVELKLVVTPQITNSGSVIMDVDVMREFAGAIEDQETKARGKNSRRAKTKVLVNNGQTAVIGGIYQSDITESENGVPGLKNIPIIGWLFKGRSQEKRKNELLIFLTPRILNLQEQAVK